MNAMRRTDNPWQRAAARVIILGASNVARGISTIVETASSVTCVETGGTTIDFMIAAGHGRSYGIDSSILTRRLPGIEPCGLWKAMADRPALPTFALITDLGNDIFYNQTAHQIKCWLQKCIERLQGVNAKTVITGLPMENAERLTPRQYAIVRRLFYPGCTLTFAQAMAAARAYDDCAMEIAQASGLTHVRLPASWYGWDPLHIQMKCWPQAWSEILSPWDARASTARPAKGSLRRAVYIKTRTPEKRSIMGWAHGKGQPCGRLPDGSILSLF